MAGEQAHAEPKQTNRLADSTSPYLLQHAHNPVDWYPWGAEALERARREDRPIFLSIGYAACHWCHVMAHESFEDPATAALLNEHFINIKVDREERPDLDDLYMLATQLMSGSGGWPMSVWLTPALEPFYAGTYFPPRDGYGRPGFPRLIQALADAWRNRRGDLIAQAQRVVEAIREHADESGKREGASAGTIDVRRWMRLAIEQMADRFDEVHGGLGGAPKFPPHQALQLWLSALESDGGALSGADKRILAGKVMKTLDGMMYGGIYDHVGGGFARYSTDERWLVPHFEKMLYDSAQLAPVYAAASVVLEKPDYARVARQTLDFFLREMSAGGAFFSSLDADSEGAEGKYYVWTLADVHAAVADRAAAELVIEHCGLGAEGNWHESPVKGASVLAIARPADELAEKHGIDPREMRRRLDDALEKMRTFRERRPRPGLDDKILTGWNGLMLSALASAGRILGETRYLHAAKSLLEFLFSRHWSGEERGRLFRVSRHDAKAHTDAYLDDHAFLLNGLMDLIDAQGPGERAALIRRAHELGEFLIRNFEDGAQGGFFFTGPRHEQLFARMKNAADNATPSANGVAVRALLRLARQSGEERFRNAAKAAVRAFAENIERRPEFFPTILLALLEDGAISSQSGASDLRVEPQHVAELAGGENLIQLRVDPPPPAQAGAQVEVVAHLTIAAGYHVQSAQPADRAAIATVARLRSIAEPSIIATQTWMYPADRDVDGGRGYAGTVELRASCLVSQTAAPGVHALRVMVEAQPCSGSACLPVQSASAEIALQIQG